MAGGRGEPGRLRDPGGVDGAPGPAGPVRALPLDGAQRDQGLGPDGGPLPGAHGAGLGGPPRARPAGALAPEHRRHALLRHRRRAHGRQPVPRGLPERQRSPRGHVGPGRERRRRAHRPEQRRTLRVREHHGDVRAGHPERRVGRGHHPRLRRPGVRAPRLRRDPRRDRLLRRHRGGRAAELRARLGGRVRRGGRGAPLRAAAAHGPRLRHPGARPARPGAGPVARHDRRRQPAQIRRHRAAPRGGAARPGRLHRRGGARRAAAPGDGLRGGARRSALAARRAPHPAHRGRDRLPARGPAHALLQRGRDRAGQRRAAHRDRRGPARGGGRHLPGSAPGQQLRRLHRRGARAVAAAGQRQRGPPGGAGGALRQPPAPRGQLAHHRHRGRGPGRAGDRLAPLRGPGGLPAPGGAAGGGPRAPPRGRAGPARGAGRGGRRPRQRPRRAGALHQRAQRQRRDPAGLHHALLLHLARHLRHAGARHGERAQRRPAGLPPAAGGLHVRAPGGADPAVGAAGGLRRGPAARPRGPLVDDRAPLDLALGPGRGPAHPPVGPHGHLRGAGLPARGHHLPRLRPRVAAHPRARLRRAGGGRPGLGAALPLARRGERTAPGPHAPLRPRDARSRGSLPARPDPRPPRPRPHGGLQRRRLGPLHAALRAVAVGQAAHDRRLGDLRRGRVLDRVRPGDAADRGGGPGPAGPGRRRRPPRDRGHRGRRGAHGPGPGRRAGAGRRHLEPPVGGRARQPPRPDQPLGGRRLPRRAHPRPDAPGGGPLQRVQHHPGRLHRGLP